MFINMYDFIICKVLVFDLKYIYVNWVVRCNFNDKGKYIVFYIFI